MANFNVSCYIAMNSEIVFRKEFNGFTNSSKTEKVVEVKAGENVIEDLRENENKLYDDITQYICLDLN